MNGKFDCCLGSGSALRSAKKMKLLITIMLFPIVFFFSSCVSNTAPKENWDQPRYTGEQRKEKRSFSDSIVDGIFASAFDSTFKSSRDKEIDSDTKRMLKGKPLKHHSSEKHLRASRDQWTFDEWDRKHQESRN